jgi:AraC-like DNA-binding protein
LEIRDNRCSREDPALSPETPPLGWHEVTLPRAGIWYRHLGRAALPVDAHHVHFLNRGESHRVSHPYGCGDRNTGLVVAARALHSLMVGLDPRATPETPFARTHARLDDRTDAAHRVLLAAVRSAAIEPLEVEELALRLLAATVQGGGNDATADLARSRRDLAEAARGLLHQDLAMPVSLADLATRLCSSPFHLCRVFAAHAGMPLHRYRLLLRLRAATGLLVETRAPLAEIAAATGFHDRSHLSRVFTRRLGMAPAELRRRARGALLRELVRGLLPAD